jgi:hypothetical protein
MLGKLFQDSPVIRLTFTNSSAVITDALPWVTTAGDSYMPVDMDPTGAGQRA